MRASFLRQWRKCFLAALRWRCKIDGEWGLNRCQRWWYTFKALVCLLLCDWTHSDMDFGTCVDVAEIHYAKLYAGWEQEIFRVGRGVFSGWSWDIEKDGEWNM